MKRLVALVLVLLLLSGCSPQVSQGDETRHILCTTYPVYLLTTALTDGTEGVSVELMIDQKVSCLHDYTLTVADMKAVERADVIVMNGAGLEGFLSDALGQRDVPVIDCSAGVDLLPSPDSDEDGWDPHIWMDPENAQIMLGNIAIALDSALYGPESSRFHNALCVASEHLAPLTDQKADHPLPLITFHDGFAYFAAAYGLELLAAIEEEEGAEASAKELEELVALVRERDIPAIFVEKNGSRRSAEVIARETGCQVRELDLVMSGDGRGIQAYRDAMTSNWETVREALG